MRLHWLPTLLFLILGWALTAQNTHLNVPGLDAPVEILTDQWGVAHIYATTEHDLFFAQGFYAARDRLFQFEIWRRQATGTVAEILGPREVKRDLGTRLFMFRGDIEAEMQHYHPRGAQIIRAFVDGVNACVRQMRANPANLPIEFELLGILPGFWTPEVVISRHQGLLGNINQELNTGRLVAMLGPEKVQQIHWFHPRKPELALDPAINAERLHDDILELYNAFRRPVRFRPEDLVAGATDAHLDVRDLADEDAAWKRSMQESADWLGSNNWVVDGRHTSSGYPVMANDPHRTLAAPSLRYMTHLIGPGWNVIGGGEPEIPGISIGHNAHGAWGLTVFRTDAEDLYVYQTNPDDPDQYRYRDGWRKMVVREETIQVKNADEVTATLKYTHHGPVVYEDPEHHLAYAVRCGWLDIGGSPYLASLRMNQAENFAAFRDACNYSNIPGENMIWADRAGNIGWQAVGIAPLRRSWSGLVPVPGDGRYEWDGYLPIIEKPHVFNPPGGIFITANENVTPPGYQHWDAIGYSWSDPFRGDRLAELLDNGRKHTLADMARYQTDYLSVPARHLIPLLEHVTLDEHQTDSLRRALLGWDGVLDRSSVEASVYVGWEAELRRRTEELYVPVEARDLFSPQMSKVIEWLTFPDGAFGPDPLEGRDRLLGEALVTAVDWLRERLGSNPRSWQYGQERLKHVVIRHPLSRAVNDSVRALLDVGIAPRGGNAYTVGNTSNNLNQSSGASFRIIVDTGDWDQCLAMNSPGQAGDPHHPHYRNLFDLWAADRFFPLFFSREKVESVTSQRILLRPR